jgi:hypothetical protein
MSRNGFEVLVEAAEDNARARDSALFEEDDSPMAPRREGIPVNLWRALPDSPGDE